jgi:hypothetical protein
VLRRVNSSGLWAAYRRGGLPREYASADRVRRRTQPQTSKPNAGKMSFPKPDLETSSQISISPSITMAAISLFSAAAHAFQVGLSLKPASPALRTTSPAMFAPGTELATTLPTITAIAEGDDTTLFLASGGLIFFIFLFAVRLRALECTWLLLIAPPCFEPPP